MKKLLSLFMALCLFFIPMQTINAQKPVDIIYNVINKNNSKSSGLDLINSIIGKDSKANNNNKGIEIINNEKELNIEIENKKKDNRKTEKEQLKGCLRHCCFCEVPRWRQ